MATNIGFLQRRNWSSYSATSTVFPAFIVPSVVPGQWVFGSLATPNSTGTVTVTWDGTDITTIGGTVTQLDSAAGASNTVCIWYLPIPEADYDDATHTIQATWGTSRNTIASMAQAFNVDSVVVVEDMGEHASYTMPYSNSASLVEGDMLMAIINYLDDNNGDMTTDGNVIQSQKWGALAQEIFWAYTHGTGSTSLSVDCADATETIVCNYLRLRPIGGADKIPWICYLGNQYYGNVFIGQADNYGDDIDSLALQPDVNLLVVINQDKNGDPPATAITYNGSSLVSGYDPTSRQHMWYLANPTADGTGYTLNQTGNVLHPYHALWAFGIVNANTTAPFRDLDYDDSANTATDPCTFTLDAFQYDLILTGLTHASVTTELSWNDYVEIVARQENSGNMKGNDTCWWYGEEDGSITMSFDNANANAGTAMGIVIRGAEVLVSGFTGMMLHNF